jgi:hypothetical protein
MPRGVLPDVGMANSVTVRSVLIRTILLPLLSVNQTLPSGPRSILE